MKPKITTELKESIKEVVKIFLIGAISGSAVYYLMIASNIPPWINSTTSILMFFIFLFAAWFIIWVINRI